VTFIDILVAASGAGAIGLLAWFFFGPRKSQLAALQGGSQQVHITVKGGYSPNLIRARRGIPLRLVFDRQESGECTSRVVFPDFALNRALPAYTETTVELLPDREGEFGFACGMNMVHGTLVIEADGGGGNGVATGVAIEPVRLEPVPTDGGGMVEADDIAERKAEIDDLLRRLSA
jgi:Cu+-exporting ATPase